MLASTMGNNIITTVVYALFAWVFVRAVGNNWLQSLSYLAYAQPALYKLPVFPNPFFLASVLTNNLALALAINISLFVANVVLITSNWVGMTRIVFGMSFDRILPTKLADVSDRFHSPVISVLFLTFLGFVGLVGVVYYGPMFGMVNMNLAYAIAYTVGCLAAAAFPFAKKSLYQRSVIARYNVGGFPIITIVGIAAAAGFVWIAYSAGLNPSISPVSNYAFASLALAFIGSGALYYIFRAYHKAKEGIDIGRNFMEIPPE
jgi:basic amino acid/polyamine antiporter, APA family